MSSPSSEKKSDKASSPPGEKLSRTESSSKSDKPRSDKAKSPRLKKEGSTSSTKKEGEKKKKRGEKKYLRAIKDFYGQGNEELTIKKGDIIVFKNRDESGYLLGELKGKTGYFPSDAVEQVEKGEGGSWVVVQESFLSALLSPRSGVSNVSVVSQKHETEEKLSNFLVTRPEKSELVSRNILHSPTVASSLQEAQKELEKQKTKDFLANFLRDRDAQKEPLLTEEAVDELVIRMTNKETGVKLGKHSKIRFGEFDNVFKGAEGVEWLLKNNLAQSKEDARGIMSFMVDVGVLDHVTKHKKGFKAVRLYRFYLHETQHRQMNRDKFWHSAGRDAGEVAIMLLNIIIDLLKKFKKNDGGVNWEALRASDEWKKWSLQTSELQKVDVGKLSKEAKRAFFVNVYNLMVLHAHSKFGPPTTMLERKRVQEELCYNVGGHEYTLEIIDNWILRGELPHSVLKDDPRHQHVLSLTGYNWIFALSDGTKNTPTFRVYEAANFDAVSTEIAKLFLQANAKANSDMNEIIYPKLLERFPKQFKIPPEKIHTKIGHLLPEEVNKFIAKVTSAGFTIGSKNTTGTNIDIKFAAPDNSPNYLA